MKRFEKAEYEASVKLSSEIGNPKPSFEERERLIKEYEYNSMTRLEKINAGLLKVIKGA